MFIAIGDRVQSRGAALTKIKGSRINVAVSQYQIFLCVSTYRHDSVFRRWQGSIDSRLQLFGVSIKKGIATALLGVSDAHHITGQWRINQGSIDVIIRISQSHLTFQCLICKIYLKDGKPAL